MSIITITRGSLSASRQLAERICGQLGSTVVTREHVIECARAYGIDETGMSASGFMEKHPPQFWDRQASQRRLYLIFLRACLLRSMTTGKVVYIGHLAQFMLTSVPKLLRVRVDASMALRVKILMEHSNLSESQAREHIADIDAKRRSWAKFVYGVDYDSPLNYDIILNRDRMSLDSLAEIVTAVVQRPEFTVDDEALTTIKNLHLAAVVSAYLARDIRTRGMELAVDCDAASGATKVRGMSTLVGADTWAQDIRRVAAEAPGVTSVEVVDAR
jgi:cytidylate kinase